MTELLAFPLAVLAEVTHRCPLQCPYCYNPVALQRGGEELTTPVWLRAIEERPSWSAMRIHFSGGEPTARGDLEALVRGRMRLISIQT